MDGQLVENLVEELQANRNLLSALAGPRVTLELTSAGARRPIAMTKDDFTRVMVNLVRNAAEAMKSVGMIKIALKEEGENLTLSIEDNGPGIPEDAFQAIFSHGYLTYAGQPSGDESGRGSSWGSNAHRSSGSDISAWPKQHRGLGLSIVRAIVSAAGGVVSAANRLAAPDTAPLISAMNSSFTDQVTDPHANPGIEGAIILIQLPVVSVSRTP